MAEIQTGIKIERTIEPQTEVETEKMFEHQSGTGTEKETEYQSEVKTQKRIEQESSTKRPEQVSYFPLFVDLWQKKVVIVGAGTIAMRRIHALLPFEPELWVMAPEIVQDDTRMPETVHFLRQSYEPSVCQGAFLVLAATDDKELNARICLDGRKAGAYVNNASDHSQCDFYFPGIIQDGNRVVGINGGGRDHAGTKQLRKKLEQAMEIDGDQSVYQN